MLTVLEEYQRGNNSVPIVVQKLFQILQDDLDLFLAFTQVFCPSGETLSDYVRPTASSNGTSKITPDSARHGDEEAVVEGGDPEAETIKIHEGVSRSRKRRREDTLG